MCTYSACWAQFQKNDLGLIRVCNDLMNFVVILVSLAKISVCSITGVSGEIFIVEWNLSLCRYVHRRLCLTTADSLLGFKETMTSTSA